MADGFYPDQANLGLYIPTTQIWEVELLYDTDVNSPQFKELLVRMYQTLNRMALAVNKKDTGIYPLTEFVTGKTYFPDPNLNSTTALTPTERDVFRKVINFGALANAAGTQSVAHGITITSGFTFTRIYATTSDTTNNDYLPIPYSSSVVADIIELSVDSTNVNITIGKDRSTFTFTYVILEFIKS